MDTTSIGQTRTDNSQWQSGGHHHHDHAADTFQQMAQNGGQSDGAGTDGAQQTHHHHHHHHKAESSSGAEQGDSGGSSGAGPTSTGSGAASTTTSTAATGAGDGNVPDNLKDIDSKYGAAAQKAVDDANAKYGSHLTKTYLEAEIMKESGGDPNAVGDNGQSIGLVQINSGDQAFTSGDFAGQNRNDVQTNLEMGAADMAQYNVQYGGDVQKTANAYETGGDASGTQYLENGRSYGSIVESIMDGGN